MKLRDHKCRKVTKHDFSGKSHFQKFANFTVLTQNAQIWKIGLKPLNFGKFRRFSIWLKLPHHYASNEPSTTIHTFIKIKLCQFYWFWPKMPKYGKLGPDPQILGNFDFFNLVEIALPLCFQRALNHYSHFYITQVMPILLFWPKIQSYHFGRYFEFRG